MASAHSAARSSCSPGKCAILLGRLIQIECTPLIPPIRFFHVADDWSTSIAELPFFWEHKLIPALIIAFVPSVLISLILLRLADVQSLKIRDLAGSCTIGCSDQPKRYV